MALGFSAACRRCVPPLVLTATLLGQGVVLAAPTVARFEPFGEVGGTALILNGKGTRVRLGFKVYDLALYTTRQVSTGAELLALPGPKKLLFVAQRDLSGTDLGRLLLRGISDNTPSLQLNRHVVATNRLIEVFSGKERMLTGESFAIEYQPGKGTSFYIQNLRQGAPVGDDEFFGMVLRIWFGEASVDPHLRDALLDGGRD
jgi:hypothetical protein